MRRPVGRYAVIFLILFASCGLSAYAQQWTLDIEGTVSSQNDKSKLSGAKVIIYKNGSRMEQIMTDAKGKFAYSLPPDAKYLVEFTYDGYVTKRISFNVKNVPPEQASQGNFLFKFDMTLFKEVEGLNVSILNQPLAEVMYDPTIFDFNYDKEYTKSIKAQIEQLQQDLEEKLAAEAAAAKAKEAEYAKAMADGDKAAAKNDYEAAKRYYAAALAVKPEDNSAKNKLDDATKKYDKIRAEKQQEKMYKEAIENAELALYEKDYKTAEAEFQKALDAKPGDIYARDEMKKIKDMMVNAAKNEQIYITSIGKADAALAAKDYLTAKGEYTKASEAKPEEAYPKDQLKQVDALLAADAKKQTEYIQAVERGETSLENKDFEAAKAAFTQASQIKPEEKYPKDQLAKIDGLLKDIELKNKSYDEAVKRGDAALAANDFAGATKGYKDALGIKPEQQYPKDQLALISKKEEEAKQKEAQYAELIKGADDRYNAHDLIAAKAEYAKALEIKPNEAHPKSRIDEITKTLEKEAKVEEEYKSAIANADNAFKAKDYTSAKFEYEAASKLKPNEAYPKDQLAKVTTALADIAKNDEQYNASIKQADELFNAAKFTEAQAAYTQASGLKPEEQYPKDQLKAIEGKLVELANMNKQYDAAIAAADKLFNEKKLEEAKASYQQALDIKPTETYPKEKIAAITDQLAAAKQAEEGYKAALADADAAFNSKEYDKAKTAYEKASGLKPEETYPKDRIAEIGKLQADMAAKQKQYEDLIAKADAAFNANKLEEALPVYKEAAGVKEGESYPVTQITLIEGKLGEMKKQDEAYKGAIAAAEAAEKGGDLAKALTEFKSASSIKPEETYPKEKITALTAAIADKEKAEAAYQEAITLADEAKKNKEYDIALASYKKASDLKPNETYPKEQMKEMEVLKAEALAAIELANKQEAQYKELVQQGDDLFGQKKYAEAKEKYKGALGVKPNETYPQGKITEIDGLLAGLAEEQLKEEKYKGLIAEADKAFKAKEWEKARSGYNEAKSVKPEETYPPAQLKAIDEAIAAEQAMAAAAEKEAAAKEKEEKYNAAIATADQAFKAKNWEGAKASYNEALAVKPGETYPTEQLLAIETAIAEAAALAAKEEQEAAAKEKDEKYNAAIASADKAFKAKEWENARAGYKEAQGVKPQETYPGEQLKAIDDAIASEKALAAAAEQEAAAKEKDAKYSAAIATADKAFKAKDWENARTAYNEAQSVKPAETYPGEQIKAIDAAIAEATALAAAAEKEAAAKERDDKYNAAIASADKAFKAKDWGAARSGYKEAQSVKPNETYPTEQLKAIDEAEAAANALAAAAQKEAAAKEREEKYKNLIAAGDKAFKSKDWNTAKSSFQEAKTVKPEETYPAEQLALIEDAMAKESLLADEKAKKDKYNGHIAAADKAFKSKDWENAEKEYKAALAVMPEEKYPAEQLVKVGEAMAKANEIALKNKKDEEYRQIIGDADQLYNVGDWKASRRRYQDALGVKPAEAYPAERIADIDAKLAELEKDVAAKDKQYAALISKGDADFNAKNYSGARNAYKSASDLKSDEAYPKDRIAEIDKLLKDQEADKLARKANQEKREQYNAFVLKGDRAFSAKQYPTARDNYVSASGMFPEEEYPKNRIKEIDEQIRKQNAATEPVAEAPKHKSSGLSDEEIAAMMLKWQQEREQAKADRMDQLKKDVKDMTDEDIAASEERRTEANDGINELVVNLEKANKAGQDRNLDEAKLVEEIRDDHEKFMADHASESEQRRNAKNQDIEQTQEGQLAMKKKGNELYVINTEKMLTEKIELNEVQQNRQKAGHEKIVQEGENIAAFEKDIQKMKEGHVQDHMKDVERIQNEQEQVLATMGAWDDESRERRGEANQSIDKQREEIAEFQKDHGKHYMPNTEKFLETMKTQNEYLESKQKQSEKDHNAAYGDIVEYTKSVQKSNDAEHNRYDANIEEIRKEQNAIHDYHSQMSANADERRLNYNPEYYRGEELPRLPEVAREYPQGVTEETYQENESYVVKRFVVKGENIDEYTKTYFKWGGIYYKKNGQPITEVIWNTETQ